jgi:L-threonylcarbamoyladenylate synthase
MSFINILKDGGIGILPTDTLYGLVGQALNPDTVERIYQVRKRRPDKPFIVLISDISDLDKLEIKLDDKSKKVLEKVWPGQVSVILPCSNKKLEYLHRGMNLAIRLPDQQRLKDIIKSTGPLVAPSANFEGENPAYTIAEAKDYFGDRVDFYEDVGKLESEPSTLIRLKDGEIEVLRQGAVVVV